ncbi:MAG: PHP domain-containing protein [Omnitrophica bacterium]|nr:PHP domain-containing protein [Candidatus Omnitrophota bacterium]
MKYADLHIHTKFSDGSFTPEQVIEQAQQLGLSCVAITDHDEVAGIGPAIKCASDFDLEVIPGVELSVEIDSNEVHILGYFIDWQQRWFQDKLKTICQVRKTRALTIIERLKAQGINLAPDELLQEAEPGSVGRLHIARMLEKHGFVHSTQEAFNKYIGNGRLCYVKKFKLSPAEAIEMIRRLKGVAVLAHPYHIANSEQLINEFVQLGLRGIEAHYPEHDKATSEYYQNLAQKHGLLITGGSDYHGLGKAGAQMGDVKIPYDLVEQLKKEAESIRSGQAKK